MTHSLPADPTSDDFARELLAVSVALEDLLARSDLHPAFAPPELAEAAWAYPRRGGKALRAALLLWSSRALGGDEAACRHAGLAIELYHAYTLVHDDVIDRDPMRRGLPSVHRMMEEVGHARFALGEGAGHYGTAMAILAGDCLHAWAVSTLAQLPERTGLSPEVALLLISRLQGRIGTAIVEGEAHDLQLPFRALDLVRVEDALLAIRTKTAELFSFAAWAGAVIALGDAEDPRAAALGTFGELAGIAFQLQDDVLGIIGDEAVLGKPVGGDLREGKRTLIILRAWARADAAGRALLTRVLGCADCPAAETAAATRLLVDLGAVEEVQAEAENYRDRAVACLDALPASPALPLLRALATRMVRRSR